MRFTKTITRASIAALLSFLPNVAIAGETAWQEVAPGAQMRMISSDKYTGTTTQLAIELRMAPALKTYWRVPGETGIPTQISMFLGGVSHEFEIHWPYPKAEVTKGFVDHVYHGDIVLPVSMQMPDGASKGVVSAEVIMGICSDICVPVRAAFELPLQTQKPDMGNGLRIRQAFAQIPIAWDRDISPIAGVWNAKDNAIEFELKGADIHPGSVLVEIVGTTTIFDRPEPLGESGKFRMTLIGPKPEALDSELQNAEMQNASAMFRFTFLTQQGPYEIVQSLLLAPSGT